APRLELALPSLSSPARAEARLAPRARSRVLRQLRRRGHRGAMKLARAYARQQHASSGSFDRVEILALENSFHGRTFGALAATWPLKYRQPFEPLVPGVRFVRLNDVSHLRDSFSPRVAAILIETIQGEGGVVPIGE